MPHRASADSSSGPFFKLARKNGADPAKEQDVHDPGRTVGPRMEMSALISGLCEYAAPEIDWAKLGEDNNRVCDIHTGLKLDKEQQRLGRETGEM